MGEPDGNQIITQVKCEIASVKKEKYMVVYERNTSRGQSGKSLLKKLNVELKSKG